MRYRNPTLADTDHESDLRAERREFWHLLLAVTALVSGLMFVFDRVAVWAAPRMPFAWEAQVARTLHLDIVAAKVAGGATSEKLAPEQQIQDELQRRLQRIAQAVNLPPEMTVTAHYVDSPTVNAFATLGGHITVFSGLLKKLEYEEELDAVLAHELGHVQHRHMVRQIGRGISMAAVLGLVGVRSQALNRWLVGDLQQFQQLAYSRDAEREADATAAQAAKQLYGHTVGIERLFQRFDTMQKENGGAQSEWENFFQSHPLPSERAQAVASMTAPSQLTPLPSLLQLKSQKGVGLSSRGS